MRIIRAEQLGMCFGVRDAVSLALGQAEAAPLTILGDLVHNEAILSDLRAKGIAIAHDPAEVKTRAVMITAHGASERTLNRVPTLEVNQDQTVATRATIDAFLAKTHARMWIQHDFTGNAQLKKAPAYYE